ncbi:hypothetical protein CASFOL_038633 [Castilleja foliolosa]|uniref:Peptidase A1 domain-containing protein n=1 Tax=Castilleja foliolosa TaxID=1961234 RepID=A0ABD3BLK6_9LAMI
MMIFRLYSSLLLILFFCIPMKSLALESHFETVKTAPECKRLFADPEKRPKSTLEVFHMYGPCSPAAVAGTTPMNMSSVQDILHLDRQRIESLQSQFIPNSTTKKYDSRFPDTKVASLSVSFSTRNYAISISLGTPQQVVNLIFDTGSRITWSNGFHPHASTSLTIISCDGFICGWYLPDHTCETFNNIENTCHYEITYADGTYTKGALCMDILSITQTDVFQHFLFGCSTEVEGQFQAEGILGLSRDAPITFVSQTEPIYNKIFSYCLPSSPSSTGFLKLGPRDYPNNVEFTYLIDNPDYPTLYFIDIISIRVGDVQLSTDEFHLMFHRTIIDTGAVITRLPINIYTMMRDEFKRQMEFSGYPIVPVPFNFFDTCYDISINLMNNIVPTITFTFGDVDVDMDGSATLYALDEWNVVCLAFVVNGDDHDFTVFGNHQQKKLEVVYDVAGGRLGFSPDGCH